MLIKKGIDVNHKASEHGISALYWSGKANSGHFLNKLNYFKHLFDQNTDKRDDIVKILLENGVDPNYKEIENRTALHRAALYGFENVIKVLIAHKADVNVKDNNGFNPLHMAVQNGNIL